MSFVRLTKEFDFEMAHALWQYDGPCKNIHGHSYRLFVTLMGEPIADEKNAKFGMVIDFKDLKSIVHKSIVDRFDHAVVINENAPHDFVANVTEMFDKTEIMTFQPTCENLIVFFAEELKKNLPSKVLLHSLRLNETATSYAEWYASDNQ